MPPVFLSADWRDLVMLNYAIDPSALRRRIPRGVELDDRDGTHFVSVVGFRFLNTRLLGLPVPGHRDFPEVNLRYYVRRKAASGGWDRGVGFVREIVPRAAIAGVARMLYNEAYSACPMSESVTDTRAEYRWKLAGRWQGVAATFSGEPKAMKAGSDEEFIAEHYWGFVTTRGGSTLGYRVEHPAWRVWAAESSTLDADVSRVWGPEFADALAGPPALAFVAEGSPVRVRWGSRIDRGDA